MKRELLMGMAAAAGALWVCVGQTTGPGTQPAATLPAMAAEGAALEKISDQFSFTEGPACDSKGNVFFTDQPNDTIWEIDVEGKLSVFMKPSGRSNGLSFDKDDNLISCADENNQLWLIGPDKKVTVLIEKLNDKLLDGPNDVWLLPEKTPGAGQGLYFTDPLYKRDYWTRDPKVQQAGEYVYYVSPDRKTVTPVVTDMVRPNGIIGTPDGKMLYVSDLSGKKTWSYTINDDATLSNKKLFCAMGSDGMTIDSEGNVYLTGRGVTIFAPSGEQAGHIDVPGGWSANVVFGGKDRKTLYITASKCLYALRMKTHGVGSS